MIKKYFFLLLFIPIFFYAQLLENVSFDKFFNENTNVMLLIDPSNGQIVKANKASQKFYLINVNKLENMNIKDINSFTKSQVQNEMQKAKTEKRNYFIFNHKLANGNVQKVRVFSSPISYGNKKLLHSTIYPLVLEKEYKDYYNKTLEEQVAIQAEHIKQTQEEITLYLFLAIIFLILLIIILFYSLVMKNKFTRKLELESKKLTSIINNIPDLLWIKNKNGTYLACNNKFEEFFGAKENQIVGKTDYDFIDKELADSFKKHDENAMNSNTPLFNYEEVTFASDNHKEFLHTTKTKVLDNNNNLIGILGIGKDVTHLNELKKSIENEKYKYKTIMEYSSDAIVIVDMNAKVLEYSNEFKNILGYSDEELTNIYVYDFEYIHTKEIIFDNINSLGTRPMSFESQYKRKDGDIIDVSVNIVKIQINDENYIHSSIRDITKQKAMQKYILNQKDEFETIFKSVREGIAILDLKANILNCNDAFINLTGYTKEELITKSFYQLTSKEDKKTDKDAISYVLEHEYLENLENKFIKKDSSILNVNISISLLLDKQRLLLTIKDMTTIKMLEQNERLASMGEMIGNIAHQWRQPLSVITASASGMKLMMEINDEGKEKFIYKGIDSIISQSDYLSKTIDNFRDFVKGDISYTIVSIKETLLQTISLIDASLKMNYISIVSDLDKDIKINGSIQELEQAFLNIINNAKDILKDEVENIEDRIIFIQSKKISNNSLQLTIKDTGGGIDPNIIDKIFEPYFTTKHKSQGTGLGLAMVDKIIRERHKGTIAVDNQTFTYKGKEFTGTEFKIIFTNN